MARPVLAKPIQYRVEAALAYGLYGLFRVLPVAAASAIGGHLAQLFGPLSRAHQTAQRNLTRALPELSSKQRREILSDVWNNLGRVVAEYATLSRLWQGDGKGRVEVQGLEHITALAEAGKPALFFAAHLANWEVAALTAGWTTKLPALVYRAPNNPLIEALLQNARGKATAALIPKGAPGARAIMRVLKTGGFVEMAVDQKMNTGLPVPFFGREAMTGDAVARLALRHNCALVPLHCERLEGCRFRVTFEPPWYPQSSADPDADVKAVLLRINQTIEGWIRARPGQWLWLHNRWPRDEN